MAFITDVNRQKEKLAAYAILVQLLPEEVHRAAQATCLHVDREHRIIQLAMLMTDIAPDHWKILTELGSVPLDDYPALAESRAGGFLLI